MTAFQDNFRSTKILHYQGTLSLLDSSSEHDNEYMKGTTNYNNLTTRSQTD